MGKYWKWALLSFLVSAGAGFSTYNLRNVDWSALDYQKMLRPITYNPTKIELGIDDTVVLSSEARMRRKVRAAAVEISTAMGTRGSGTYFKIDDRHLIVTATHVVSGSPVVSIIGRNGEQVFGTPVMEAEHVDMTFILIPAMNSRTPMNYKPLGYQDIDKYVGEEVTYTGFPSHHDLLTIDGAIASHEEGNLIMHSYAWPGSSGAGVFDFDGNFVGVVRAVDLGVWDYRLHPTIIEDIVWVAPAWGISKREIKDLLKQRGM